MIRRPPTFAGQGLVVSAHPLASEAGVSVLRQGGNAVDAAVAAAAVLSVVEPSASGLGGDSFFLIFEKKGGTISAVNGNGAAPGALAPEVFRDRTSIPVHGPLACTVPGCVSGWKEAWYGWGRLEWRELLQPALALASEGFPVSWRMGRILRRDRELLSRDRGLAALLLHADGSPLRAGEICRPKALARTLAILAEDEGESFYEGEVAERLCKGLKALGAVLTPEDLAGHEAALLSALEWAVPGTTGLRLYEQPLPTQGILLPVLLNLLSERRDRKPWEELNAQIQAGRIGLQLRSLFLGDAESLPLPQGDLVEFLLSQETAAALRPLLEDGPPAPEVTAEAVLSCLDRASGSATSVLRAYAAAGLLPGPDALSPGASGADTTYLCAADKDGNVAGLIQSIFHPFGAGILEPSTGIILNNRASAFSLDPARVNHLRPGARPMHTLNSWMLATEEAPWLAGGTPGADQQIQTSLQILRSVLLGRRLWPGPEPMLPGHWSQRRREPQSGPLPIEELLPSALEAPRWNVQGDGRILLEARFPADCRRRLRKLGHEPVRVGPWEGSGLFQAVCRMEGGALLGATDPRGEGMAAGF